MGHPHHGKTGHTCHILNVTSLAGLLTIGDMPSYYATNHFSSALAESVYYDLQHTGTNNIKMSVFCPSYVHTDLHHYERHRPERYKIPADDPYYTSEAYKNELKKAEHVITTGSPVDSVGPPVFENIEKENFYIQMHPSTKPMIRHQMKDILKERNPDFRFTDDIGGPSRRKSRSQEYLVRPYSFLISTHFYPGSCICRNREFFLPEKLFFLGIDDRMFSFYERKHTSWQITMKQSLRN